MTGRFFFGTDCSGHRYLVLFEHRQEWLEWISIPDDDPRCWDVPEYAQRIDGEQYSFENPEVMS